MDVRRPRWYVSGDLDALAAWLLALVVSVLVLGYALGWWWFR